MRPHLSTSCLPLPPRHPHPILLRCALTGDLKCRLSAHPPSHCTRGNQNQKQRAPEPRGLSSPRLWRQLFLQPYQALEA